ncbi:MAG TPA: preprotein translocase subunit SecE [Bacteroidia bacterium]|jgi:preprotein translocase subunit SecE|nr:preprotein translocase subunit SecE [Bacteroidia bacterium]
MSKFGTYIDEVTEELVKKVSWPTWAELQSSAVVVLVASVITSAVIFGMDYSFRLIMTAFYGIK